MVGAIIMLDGINGGSYIHECGLLMTTYVAVITKWLVVDFEAQCNHYITDIGARSDTHPDIFSCSSVFTCPDFPNVQLQSLQH